MNQQILDQVLSSPRLPSLPAIAIEIIDLVQQPHVNMQRIASTISHDPALSSRILKTVNSSFYGQSQLISTISHAMVVLGLNSVKTLALGFSLVSNLRKSGDEGFDHINFWKRSLYSAVAARLLAKQFNLLQKEEAFLGGLLQDLGLLAMSQALGPPYHQMVASTRSDHRCLAELERQAYQTDHAEVGGALADLWKLPPILNIPIRAHEDTHIAPEELRPMAQCVHLGACLAQVFISSSPNQALEHFHDLAHEWFGMNAEQTQPLLDRLHRDTLEMRTLFELPLGQLQSPEQILARADEALAQISLEQQQQAQELQQRAAQFEEQAATDPLTGLANRRKLDDFLACQFNLNREEGRLSVLFLDADHFKKLNDKYGHAGGDVVLIELANTLKGCTPPQALAARYGGEEFALVMPGVGRRDATRQAEELRRQIEELAPRGEDGQPIRVTVSIGVASSEGGNFTRAEQLLNAADQAVYAAKHAGRNCVRIFSPKARTAA